MLHKYAGPHNIAYAGRTQVLNRSLTPFIFHGSVCVCICVHLCAYVSVCVDLWCVCVCMLVVVCREFPLKTNSLTNLHKLIHLAFPSLNTLYTTFRNRMRAAAQQLAAEGWWGFVNSFCAQSAVALLVCLRCLHVWTRPYLELMLNVAYSHDKNSYCTKVKKHLHANCYYYALGLVLTFW